jgi:hypothetical protein
MYLVNYVTIDVNYVMGVQISFNEMKAHGLSWQTCWISYFAWVTIVNNKWGTFG